MTWPGADIALDVDADVVTETAPAPHPQALSSRPASLVIQTSVFRDMTLTTPLIAELAARGPVDVVATPASAPLLSNNPSIRTLIPYDKRGDAIGLFGLWRAARSLADGDVREDDDRASGRIATAYLADGSMRSAMLAVLAGIEDRVGFSTAPNHPLCTRVVPWREDIHHAERLWQLGAAPLADRALPEQIRPRLFPGDAEISAVDELLREYAYDGEPLVAFAPGGARETKQWPHFPALVARIGGRARIAVIGGAADAPLARAIKAAAASGAAIDATGRLSLLASAELIGRSAVLVANDSAPTHLASAMGTPTVTVFGPTVPGFGYEPLAPRHASAGHAALPCRPCDRQGPRRCPLGHWRCMREITADAVMALVGQVTSNAIH